MNSDTPITDAAAYVPDMTATTMVVRLDVARELERKLNIATALLTRADDLLFRANTLMDGWPQALKWNREYERSKKLKP